MASVCSFGAVGDGIQDDSAAFQKALDGAGQILIPQGCYRIGKTLKIHSGTTIVAEPNARMVMDGSRRWSQGEFLLDNADHDRGNRDIRIIGGIWDGNNRGEQIVKGDILDLSGYSGAVLNFCHVENLVLQDLTVANSLTYNIRMARLDGFVIDNVAFLSDAPAHNQDGLHFNGEVRHGRVRNIRALSYGQTNDDLIALNADDSMERVENVGMVRGRLRTLCLKISMRKIAIPLFVCSALRPPFATLPFAMCMVASAAMPSMRMEHATAAHPYSGTSRNRQALDAWKISASTV